MVLEQCLRALNPNPDPKVGEREEKRVWAWCGLSKPQSSLPRTHLQQVLICSKKATLPNGEGSTGTVLAHYLSIPWLQWDEFPSQSTVGTQQLVPSTQSRDRVGAGGVRCHGRLLIIENLRLRRSLLFLLAHRSLKDSSKLSISVPHRITSYS